MMGFGIQPFVFAATMPSRTLEYITVQGFKSIASIEKLELGPINVLIGANGSGKSNFVEVFQFLHEIRGRRLQNYVTKAGGAEKLLHYGSKITKEIAIRLWLSGGEARYELRLSPTADDNLFASVDAALPEAYGQPYPEAPGPPYPDACGRPFSNGSELRISGTNLQATTELVHTLLGGWRVYHLHDTSESSPMRKTARVDDNAFLRADASNLAAFLYYLREKHGDSYQMVQQTVRQVAPFFEDFQLNPLRLNAEDIKLEWKHKNTDQYFDASSLSDGTLRFIALATLFLGPVDHRPSIILVDEPELGLHPYAIGILAALIRQASVDTQVIVSTQSATLLDYFEPEEVLVAERVDGATQLTRPDAARLEEWLKDYSLGQLWEKNEIGGRPVRE